MENHTSFDLNAAIRRWRENLAASPNFRADDLDELESHVHDSLRELTARGLPPEEAFTIATRRIGQGQELAEEFARINGNALWIDRLLWMLLGAVFVAIVRSLVESMVLLMGPNNWAPPLVFLYVVLLSSPLIFGLLVVGTRGTVSRVFAYLLRRPFGLSFSFLLVGLFPVALRMLAFSRTVQREVATVTILSLAELIVVALFILLLARKRLRPVQT